MNLHLVERLTAEIVNGAYSGPIGITTAHSSACLLALLALLVLLVRAACADSGTFSNLPRTAREFRKRNARGGECLAARAPATPRQLLSS